MIRPKYLVFKDRQLDRQFSIKGLAIIYAKRQITRQEQVNAGRTFVRSTYSVEKTYQPVNVKRGDFKFIPEAGRNALKEASDDQR